MTQPETLLASRIRRALQQRGCVVVKMHGSAYAKSGTPDLLGCLPGGRAFAIEVKLPGRRGEARGGCSALQDRELRRWRGGGAAAGVAYTVQDALRICEMDAD